MLVAYKFNGYFDESEDSDCLCIAGVLASTHHWPQFEDAWSAIVTEIGMPEFHMQECENRKGFWENWTNLDDRRAVQQRFIELFVKNVTPSPVGFVVAVDLAAFRGTVGPKIKSVHPGRGYDKPWLFAFMHVLDRMLMAQRAYSRMLHTDERLDLFFDEKDEFEGRVGGMLKELKQETDYPIGDVSFDDSRDQPALQAADLLAYEARRFITEVVLRVRLDKGVREQWWQLMNAKLPGGANRIRAEHWDEKALQRNINDVSVVEPSSEEGSTPVQTCDMAVRWLTGRDMHNDLN